MSITDCLNGDMLTDVFTKQLQESLFKSISNSVLNINDAVLNHKVGKEHRIVLGITHTGSNRTENRSE